MNENLDVLSEGTEAHRVVLVVKEKREPANGPTAENLSERSLIESDPIVAAEKASYEFLNKSVADQAQRRQVSTTSLAGAYIVRHLAELSYINDRSNDPSALNR